MNFDFEALTKEQLYSATTQRELLEYGEELIRYNESRLARNLAEKLERILPSSATAAQTIDTRLSALMHRLYYVALPSFFSDEELVAVFRQHIADMLHDLEYTWEDRLRAKLITIPYTRRDDVKGKMRKALFENTERLTKTFVTTSDGKEVEGTIGHWLHDFFQVAGASSVTSLAYARYFSENANVQKLSAKEKKALERLIALYERLKISSASLAGTEEEILFRDADGRFIDFDKGNPVFLDTGKSVDVIRLSKRSTATSEPMPVTEQKIVVQPKTAAPVIESDAEQMKKIDAARGKLRESGKEAVVLFFDLLSHPQGVAPATADELAAGLMILAQDNALERAITDAKIRELFIAHLRSKNQPDLLEGFRLTPTMPKFMSLFLQWALTEKGKLSENDAAQIGARIANMLKKRGNEKYSRIAYFDTATNAFRWA